jgi:hypothetical protein
MVACWDHHHLVRLGHHERLEVRRLRLCAFADNQDSLSLGPRALLARPGGTPPKGLLFLLFLPALSLVLRLESFASAHGAASLKAAARPDGKGMAP